MEDHFDSIEEQTEGITKNRLLLSIWLKPQPTLRYILENYPDKYILVFFFLGGVARSVYRHPFQLTNDNALPPGFVISSLIIGGGIIGIPFYIFYAWLLSITGKWLGGEASSENCRVVVAWSLIPTILGIVLIILELILFGVNISSSSLIKESVILFILLRLLSVGQIILGIWAFVILVQGISLIQKFGIGKSLANVFLPILLILSVIIALALLIRGLLIPS